MRGIVTVTVPEREAGGWKTEEEGTTFYAHNVHSGNLSLPQNAIGYNNLSYNKIISAMCASPEIISQVI